MYILFCYISKSQSINSLWYLFFIFILLFSSLSFGEISSSKPKSPVDIPNLGPCSDSPNRTPHLDIQKPITVLVHGINSSASRFQKLAHLYASHKQQAICFSYNDRDSLILSSDKLITAVNALADVMQSKTLTLVGHSLGGLVAYKAMEDSRPQKWLHPNQNINLVTVSAPLAGIKSANACGAKVFHWLSLGIMPGICWAISGDKWYEITPASNFIKHPKPLIPAVQQYLKIITDEKNTCRETNKLGACIKSDTVFSLAEQYHPIIDKSPRTINVQVDAGHTETIGNSQTEPYRLWLIFQEYGLVP